MVIAETEFDLSYTADKMMVRLYSPEYQQDGDAWICRFEIGKPLSVSRGIHGESSLQAIALALKAISSNLYGSELYKAGQLGIFGEFGSFLSIPAPAVFLDIAPYPF